MRRRQLEARLARELSSGAGLSMQDYDIPIRADQGERPTLACQRPRDPPAVVPLALVPSRQPDAAAGTNEYAAKAARKGAVWTSC